MSNNLPKEVTDIINSNPNGDIDSASMEDVQMLAMLAGATSQEMRKAMFIDNTSSTAASSPVDPRQIVQPLMNMIKPGANVAKAPGFNHPNAVNRQQAPQPRPQKPDNSGQLEFEFKQTALDDIFKKLDSIYDRLTSIERYIKKSEGSLDKK